MGIVPCIGNDYLHSAASVIGPLAPVWDQVLHYLQLRVVFRTGWSTILSICMFLAEADPPFYLISMKFSFLLAKDVRFCEIAY